MGKTNLIKTIVRRGAKCGAVIVAAGTSSRMKGKDKIMEDLCGEPVILRTLRAFQNCEDISDVVVVTRPDLLETVSELCVSHGIDKVTKVVKGGDTRAESVLYGLEQLPKSCSLAAVHDGARPLVPEQVIHETVCKAAKYGAAAPALPVKDTVKVVRGGVVESTPDRASLYAVQTPQVFKRALLRGALEKALQGKDPITDDCSAVEAMGVNVVIVQGSEENLKLTTPTDFILAEALLKGREKA